MSRRIALRSMLTSAWRLRPAHLIILARSSCRAAFLQALALLAPRWVPSPTECENRAISLATWQRCGTSTSSGTVQRTFVWTCETSLTGIIKYQTEPGWRLERRALRSRAGSTSALSRVFSKRLCRPLPNQRYPLNWRRCIGWVHSERMLQPRKDERGQVFIHPVRAVPGDDGECCKLPVGFRPGRRRSESGIMSAVHDPQLFGPGRPR